MAKKELNEQLKDFFIGVPRDLKDRNIFRHLTLIAFLAWIGLGSDGLTSSCYGPEESYRALGIYHSMTIFVAIAITITIFVISTSYSQIIKLFPTGGGGYKVATKLLSSNVGMVSGCTLLVDYILTIAVSISSGTDALFSLLPPSFHQFKLTFSFFVLAILLLLNLRGIKESVFSLMPIFIVFIVAHLLLILIALFGHLSAIPDVMNSSVDNFRAASHSIGTFGVIALLLRSFSMGAGTFTGIEAVSNSMPILKEPRIKTGIITMRYMAISLALTVLGLMIAYSIFSVHPNENKTLNAVLLENLVLHWNHGVGLTFVLITLVSEAGLLFVAAQTGFLDGPRVIASMASDSWFPRRFAVLSDRLVTQNGIVFMGIMAGIMLLITGGAIKVLIVLYSINVFITFSLSQAGMVKHWWIERKTEKKWLSKLLINGFGLCVTVFVLCSVVIIKFTEGGWITILITSSIIYIVSRIKKHYNYIDKLVHRLDDKMYLTAHRFEQNHPCTPTKPEFDPEGRTAVLCVSGYNGLGIKTFLKIIDEFKMFKNFIFIEVGIVDAGNFKGNKEMKNLREHVIENLENYKLLAESYCYYAEYYYSIGTDVADDVKELSKKIIAKYADAIFFIGQLMLPGPTAFQRLLHNQTQLAIHNRLAHKGYIMVMIPIKLHSLFTGFDEGS